MSVARLWSWMGDGWGGNQQKGLDKMDGGGRESSKGLHRERPKELRR
jgi:hypothetical protein